MQSPSDSVPTLAELAALAGSERLEDRAFAASTLQLRPNLGAAAELAAIYARIREAAQQAHAALRARLADAGWDRAALAEQISAVPLELRDHWVEEALGIAYPPLELRPVPQELVGYSPSGLAEILSMLDRAQLGPGKHLVDLGSGLGKVVLLTALLSGANATGVELDPALVGAARAAAGELQLTRARFLEGDLRSVPLPEADVYYLFIPLQRSAQLLQRLEPIARRRRISVFAQGLDLAVAPWLRKVGHASYWLEHFES
jgi:SAM-dependent methyltransferase